MKEFRSNQYFFWSNLRKIAQIKTSGTLLQIRGVILLSLRYRFFDITYLNNAMVGEIHPSRSTVRRGAPDAIETVLPNIVPELWITEFRGDL